MKDELLSPDTLTPQLKARRLELHNLLTLKLKAQKNTPTGHLRIEQKNGGRRIQFYHCTSTNSPRGAYIPISKAILAKNLAQKDYDSKLIKLLQRQITALEKLIKVYEKKVTELYTKLCPARQRLIEPVTLTDAQYIEEWNKVTWPTSSFAAENLKFTTARGEQVRSKSEVIIADILARYKIAYRYEYPLQLKNERTYHPDFLCLNVRTRKEYFWEHFGMMDDLAYAEKAVEKLKVYSENNIQVGRNLIITMETKACPLSPRQIESLIKDFLL
jgi:hypothetical protein